MRYRLEIAFKRARLMLERAKLKQKQFYDRQSREIQLQIGDLVLLKNEVGHKLENRYLGPFTVVELRNNSNVTIEDNKKKKAQTVHRDRLKHYST